MGRSRQAWILLLLATFWVAQVQGVVHPISHLRQAGGVSGPTLVAPSGVCGECELLDQAGAAPLPVLAAPAVLPPSKRVSQTTEVVSFASSPPAFYRSRAPPSPPI